MSYRKGDIFVHKKKGVIAVITKVEDGMYSFVHSKPSEPECGWGKIENKPISQIDEALERGSVVLYRPKVEMFDDKLFETD